jgi:hypothetical protein
LKSSGCVRIEWEGILAGSVAMGIRSRFSIEGVGPYLFFFFLLT